MIAARDGVHCDSTLKFVRRSPSDASWSTRGVGAPRMIPPPLKPGSPQPKLSMKTRTMFGWSAACAVETQHSNVQKISVEIFPHIFIR